MIVSPGRGFVFVHIPKTGGTSMALALEAHALPDDILIGDTPEALRRKHRLAGLRTAGRLRKHARLPDIAGLLPAEVLAELFVFTLVRNPWARIASSYHWLRVQRFDHALVRIAAAHDFSGFVSHPVVRAAFAAERYGDYVRGAAAPVFVRLEMLGADLAPVEAHLGFRLAVPHVNRSDRPDDWRACYSAGDAAVVAEVCAADIACFGYTF